MKNENHSNNKETTLLINLTLFTKLHSLKLVYKTLKHISDITHCTKYNKANGRNLCTHW